MSNESISADSQCRIEEGNASWPDGVRCFSKRWSPQSTTPPRSLLVALHGFAEHIGRYDHVWPIFAARNIEVFGYDQRGFGRSGEAHGDTTLEQSAADLKHILAQERKRLDDSGLSDIPIFVYAHSMVCLS